MSALGGIIESLGDIIEQLTPIILSCVFLAFISKFIKG